MISCIILEEMGEKQYFSFFIFLKDKGVMVFEKSRKGSFGKIIFLCQKEMKIIFE